MRHFFTVGYAAASTYMLVFYQGASTPHKQIEQVKHKVEKIGGNITFTYNATLTGFEFMLSEHRNGSIESLFDLYNTSSSPFFIELDSPVNASGNSTPGRGDINF